MAIGNVGTYATVEGTPVDFGKMTVNAIDKYKEGQDEQEKARQASEAAKSKAIQDREKEKLTLGKFEPITGQTGISDLIGQDMSNRANDLYKMKGQYDRGEIPKWKLDSEENSFNQIISEYKAAGDLSKSKSEEYTKNASKYYTPSLVLKAEQDKAVLGGNIVPVKKPNGVWAYQKVEKDEDGNITKILDEYQSPLDIASKFDAVPNFDYGNAIKDLTTTQAPLNKSTDFVGLTKITSETIAKNPKVSRAVNSFVSASINDPSKLAVLYSEMTGKYKPVITDSKDIEDVTKWLTQKAIDGYKESVEMEKHYIAPKSDGGDGGKGDGKMPFNPTPFSPKNSFNGMGKNANGLAIAVSDPSKKDNQVTLRNVSVGSGKNKKIISNGEVQSVFFNNDDRMVASISYVKKKGTRLSKDQEDAVVNLMSSKSMGREDALGELGITSETLGEERETFTVPLGESLKAQVLGKMGTSEGELKNRLGYKSGSNKQASTTSSPSSSYKIKGKTYTLTQLKHMGYTEEDVKNYKI